MARVSASSWPRNAAASRAATSASEGSGSTNTSPHAQRRMRRPGRRWSARARRSPHTGQGRWGPMRRGGASPRDRGAVKGPAESTSGSSWYRPRRARRSPAGARLQEAAGSARQPGRTAAEAHGKQPAAREQRPGGGRRRVGRGRGGGGGRRGRRLSGRGARHGDRSGGRRRGGSRRRAGRGRRRRSGGTECSQRHVPVGGRAQGQAPHLRAGGAGQDVLEVGGVASVVRVEEVRSEEHTSELQSPMYLVCRLLLEKKKHLNDDAVI